MLPARWPRVLIACVSFAAFFAAVFGPVLFTGKLMAGGDGLTEAVPAYAAPRHLWEPSILLGYPTYANPNAMVWYPLAWLCLIPASFNLFAVLPYWLAAVGTFGFVRALTRSPLGALVAGVGFSLGGFMISHQGHLLIIHAAAWCPFALWAIEELRTATRGGRWFAMLALSLGLCAFGQPQFLALTFALCAVYAIGSSGSAASGRWRYLARCAAAMVLGVAIASVGLIPEQVLAGQSVRSALTFAQFIAFSTPPGEVAIRLVAPYDTRLTASFAESSNFCGLGMLALAIAALLSRAADRRVWLWAAIALVSLALTTGDAFGLAHVTYALPLYDRFRIPARHAFEFTLAISVLAGYGVATLERGDGTVRAVVALAVVGALVALVQPTDATAVYSFAAVAVALVVWTLRPAVQTLRVLAFLAVAGELVFFAERAGWRSDAVEASVLRAPALAMQLAAALNGTGQRALWATGTNDTAGIAPNISLLWNVPVTSGYTPLALDRIARLIGLADDATIDYGASLDLTGTRFIAARRAPPALESPKAPFAGPAMDLLVGNPALTDNASVTLGTYRPVRADRVALVSQLTLATQIPDGATVARMRIVDVAGNVTTLPIVAGRDTAEMAYDRTDLTERPRHKRARVVETNDGYDRFGALFATRETVPVDHVTIAWVYPGRSALRIVRVTMIDDRSGAAVSMDSLAQLYGQRARFRPVPDAGFALFENSQAFPRVWIVPHVMYGDADIAFQAIHRGRSPAGQPFDAHRDAFVKDRDVPLPSGQGAARLLSAVDGRLTLAANCASACLIVSSDAWYPGWQSSVDGVPARIVRVDGALRGVVVPPGRHIVEERFEPLDALIGLACSALALAVMIVLAKKHAK